jgi:hypothetical protein
VTTVITASCRRGQTPKHQPYPSTRALQPARLRRLCVPLQHDQARPRISSRPQQHRARELPAPATTMALDTFYHNKIESMKLEIIQGQAVLRRLEAQRNDYNSRVRLLREELGLLQQPGSYVGEVVKVMGTKKVLVKVHPEGKYGKIRLPANHFGSTDMWQLWT